jgi:hypothetical protein
MYSPQYRRCVVHVTGNNRPTCLTIWQPTTPEICGPVPTGFDRSRKHSSRSRERLPPYCFVASSRSRRRRASAGAPCPTIRTGASAPAGPGSRCCSRSPSRSLPPTAHPRRRQIRRRRRQAPLRVVWAYFGVGRRHWVRPGVIHHHVRPSPAPRCRGGSILGPAGGCGAGDAAKLEHSGDDPVLLLLDAGTAKGQKP